MKLFTGTANQPLAQQVSDILNLPLAKSEVIRFDNSEVRVRIEEDVRNEVCVVIQPTANPTDTNLMELFFFCDALRRQEAQKVIGVVPYFGYARQDIQHRSGECVSANVVIRFMEAIGFDKIYTFDLHDEATQGVFTIPFKNISALPLLGDHIKTYLNGEVSPEQIAIVTPDQGGIERARKFGEHLFGTPDFEAALTEKRRDQDHKHVSKAVGLYGNVAGKVAIIVDDMTTSGGTLIHSAQLCLEQGATKAIAAIVHHDLSEAGSKALSESVIEKVFTTNTIATPTHIAKDKVEVVSIAELIAQEINS